MQDLYTFDRNGNILDGPFRSLSIANAVCDADPDALYVDALEDELDDELSDALFEAYS